MGSTGKALLLETMDQRMNISKGRYKFNVLNEKKLEAMLIMLASKGKSRRNPLSRIMQRNSSRDSYFEKKCGDVYMLPATQYVLDDYSNGKKYSQETEESIEGKESYGEGYSGNLANVVELKEALTRLDSASLKTLSPDITTSFVSANPTEVGSLIDELNIHNLPDATLLALCTMLTVLEKEPSLTWCTAFITSCFIPKIYSLKHAATRDLTSTITILADKFPRAVVEGFMVPCVLIDSIDGFQCKIVCEVFQICLSTEHQHLFLQKFFKDRKILNESLVTLLQTVLDSKVKFDESLLNAFISQLVNSTSIMAKNLKFSKLILNCIKEFGSEMSENHCYDLNATIEKTNTPLKKACQTTLKKLLLKRNMIAV